MTETTFAVSGGLPQPRRLDVVDYVKSLKIAFRKPVEAIWKSPRPLVECDEEHALLCAMKQAFYEHCPLRLTPDSIWLTIARGFALHVNHYAEELRDRFVSHAGKLKLKIERADFFPGEDNPWPEVFDQFAEEIGKNSQGIDQLLRADFSTTGPVERAISSLMSMEAFQCYFEYELYAGCGIPEVTLAGTVEDWKAIRTRCAQFAQYGLENWIEALDPILDQFIRAKQGTPDVEFWKSMFRYNSGSGPAVLSGWANVFFPYLKDMREKLYPNPYLGEWKDRLEVDDRQTWRERWDNPQGVGLIAFPACTTSVPLKLFWGTEEHDMLLIGGLMGVSQNQETLGVEPECGWAIVYDDASVASAPATESENEVDR